MDVNTQVHAQFENTLCEIAFDFQGIFVLSERECQTRHASYSQIINVPKQEINRLAQINHSNKSFCTKNRAKQTKQDPRSKSKMISPFNDFSRESLMLLDVSPIC